MKINSVTDCLLGVSVGDALGVPYEFRNSNTMKSNPAIEMIEFGTHNQPLGTWSDDSSLTFCLAESLLFGFNLQDIAQKFLLWKNNKYWTARGEVFDIGNRTKEAILILEKILNSKNYNYLSKLKNHATEKDNGNGSLMRILPLLFFIKDKKINDQFKIIEEVSALTHGHIRSSMSCLIYLKLAEYLLKEFEKKEAYKLTRNEISEYWYSISFPKSEQLHFSRIIENDILTLQKQDLKSGGYVIESLEASLYCFLNENDYKSCVLSVINLGHDTDTNAAISGGLSALYYGINSIPEKWINSLARLNDILDLCKKLENKYFN